MELKNFRVEPCKSRLAFEFYPDKKESLKLETVGKILKEKGIRVDIEAPFMLMARINQCPVTIYRSGKIMVRDTGIEEDAREIVKELILYLNEAGAEKKTD